jgi:hypothetical protein
MKYYKSVGVSFALHNGWFDYPEYAAYPYERKDSRIKTVVSAGIQGVYTVTLENGETLDMPAMREIDFYELEMDEIPPKEHSPHRKSEQFLFEVMMANQTFLLAISEGKGIEEAVRQIRQHVLHYREDVSRYMKASDWDEESRVK